MSEEKDIWQADDGRPMCRHGGRSHSLNLACPTDDCEIGERHPKWQRVEPGHVIPAGQPIRTEWNNGSHDQASELVSEFIQHAAQGVAWFVDSSWKPPLVLPTTPTWGIVVRPAGRAELGCWEWMTNGSHMLTDNTRWFGPRDRKDVADFIPLTDEQIQRIEAAR